MEQNTLPQAVRDFILNSVPTVPYLEAMLLLRMERDSPWDARRLARRLYMSERAAAQLLLQLTEAGFLAPLDQRENCYCYQPSLPALEQVAAQLASTYARKLVEISNLIHSRNGGRGSPPG